MTLDMEAKTGPICRCGCGRKAMWLISGYSPEGGYKDEPVWRQMSQEEIDRNVRRLKILADQIAGKITMNRA